jgi:hypothetical protein
MTKKIRKNIKDFLTSDFFIYLDRHQIQARIFFIFVGISLMIFSGWLGFWIGLTILVSQIDLTKFF